MLDKSTRIPPLLLQPLVENAIKHGFKNIEYQGTIDISFTKSDNRIIIAVTDNGNGINKNNLSLNNKDDHNSLSIQIIKERLQITNAQNPNFRANIIIKSKQNESSIHKGTSVVIDLSLIKS